MGVYEVRNKMNKQLNQEQQNVMARVYAYIFSLPDPDPNDELTETQPHNSEDEVQQ